MPEPTLAAPATPGAQTNLADLLKDAGITPKGDQAPKEDKPAGETNQETSPEPNASEQPVEDPRLALLREVGLQDVSDLDDGLKRLTEAFKQREASLAEVTRKAEDAIRQAEALRNQQAHKPTEPEAPKEEKPSAKPFGLGTFKKPDPSLIQKYLLVQKDEQGNEYTRWAPDTPPEFRKQAEAYGEFMDAFQNDPDAVFRAILPAYLGDQQETVTKAVEARLAAEQEDRICQQVIESSPWMFLTDPMTNRPATDPQGNLVMSQRGSDYWTLYNSIQGTPQEKHAFLSRQYQAPTPATPTAPQQTTDEKRKASQAQFLREQASRQSTDRGGTEPLGQHETQNRHAGLGQQLLEAFGTVPRT